MKNHNHNLVQQLSELLDSEWRFKQYKKDAKVCKGCTTLWAKFEKSVKPMIEDVRKEIESHSKGGTFK
ncbi:MAG: hypothetical protein NUV81_02520 [bacterium]|nr:hypothetical protein [bacterium]